MNPEAEFQRFADSGGPVSIEALFEFYDRLDPVEPDAILGEWDGSVFKTGHRKDTDDLVLGVMERKGDGSPLYFYLRRLAQGGAR